MELTDNIQSCDSAWERKRGRMTKPHFYFIAILRSRKLTFWFEFTFFCMFFFKHWHLSLTILSTLFWSVLQSFLKVERKSCWGETKEKMTVKSSSQLWSRKTTGGAEPVPRMIITVTTVMHKKPSSSGNMCYSAYSAQSQYIDCHWRIHHRRKLKWTKMFSLERNIITKLIFRSLWKLDGLAIYYLSDKQPWRRW